MYNISLILLLSSLFCYVHSLEKSPDIIIIGAGVSGIAAATKLWKANFTNIKILEAENGIGGRIKSVKFGDAFVDLGAEWCAEENNNIVYDMVKEYNILKTTNLSVKMVYSNGVDVEQDVYSSLMEFAKSMKASNTGSSLQQSLRTKFRSLFMNKYKNDPTKLNITLNAIDWLESYLLGSVTAFTFYEGHPLNWNGIGFKTILDVMLQKYPDASKALPIEDHILLDKEVSKIVWKNINTTKTSVRCSDGTVYQADFVIFTPSLGVLKAIYEKMFQPELPSEKVDAIRNFGFGAVVKVVLHFPQTWWNPKEAYEFVWSAEDKNKILSEISKGPIKEGRSWLTTSVVFVPAENNPKVLIGFFSGEMVPQIEAEDKQVLLDGCMYMFRKFLAGRFSVVNADNITKSIWYTNPHFLGSFTFQSAETNVTGTTYPDALAFPLRQGDGNLAVLFAGEATHPRHFSTVHGAIETGYREADRIIQYFAHKNV